MQPIDSAIALNGANDTTTLRIYYTPIATCRSQKVTYQLHVHQLNYKEKGQSAFTRYMVYVSIPRLLSTCLGFIGS